MDYMDYKDDPVWQRMVSGQRYDTRNPLLLEMLVRTRRRLMRLNNTDPADEPARQQLLREILGACGHDLTINSPFHCDYGCNISVGEHFFANFNLTILDEAPVTIGDYAFIGPNVSIYTACHPILPQERNACIEWAEPVIIGNNVWIGGAATILPGVTIGDNCVVGAATVVTRSLPANSVAVGNPARVVRTLDVAAFEGREQLGLDSCGA